MTHPTDDEIMELAGSWFHTGENQKRDDGYYYRSLGTPSNVRGSDLIEFARALLAEQARTEPHKAEDAPSERDAQDAARYRWLRDGELTADYPYPVMRMGGSRVDDQTIWNDELDAAIDAAMAKD